MSNIAALDRAGRNIVEDQNNTVTLTSFNDVVTFADRAAKTGMIPKQFQGKPDDIVVSIMQGMELGLNPLQSLNSIASINGRPAIYGDAPLALCYKSGKVESFEEWIEGDGEDMVAFCHVKRFGQKPVEEYFSVSDAKKASLWGKSGPWQQFPRRMLTFRARGFALRNAFPDVLAGIGIKEELDDIPMKDVTPEDDTPKGGSKASKVASKVAQKRGKAAVPKDSAPSLDAMTKDMDAAETEAALSEAAKDAQKLKGDDLEKARRHYRKRLDEIRAAAGQDKPAPAIDLDKAASMIEKDLTAAIGDGVNEVLDVYNDQMAALEQGAPDVHKRLLTLAENIRGIGAEGDDA